MAVGPDPPAEASEQHPRFDMRRRTTWVMAIATGTVVANNYYNQPLLVSFSESFKASESDIGLVPMLTQVGYAVGLLLFVPLGDMVERRMLINVLSAVACAALVVTAVSPNIDWLLAASFAVGLSSTAPQLLTPFAARLAAPDQRGSAVGLVMGGLFAGILLSRTISGFVGLHLGWRAMYWLAAAAMIIIIIMLSISLPKDSPSFRGSYAALLRSLWTLWRDHAVLRETLIVGALQYAAFGAFWTTLAFQLNRLPQHFGSEVAGLFGLLGLAGVLIAPWAGRLADSYSSRAIVLASSISMLIAYATLAASGHTLIGLAAGVILLDVGIQAGHVVNMTRNYALGAALLSRLNTVYMVSRFCGAALGSLLASCAWNEWHWSGVCTIGLITTGLAVLVQTNWRTLRFGSDRGGSPTAAR
jgi:predicted MFS family arabinose efflux permease